MEKKTAQEYLKKVIKDKIRHKDYNRTVELAEEYRILYTGKGMEKFIKLIYGIDIPSEQITSIIPPILKSTQYPFNKVFRTKPIERKIDYNAKDVESKISDLETYLGNYWNNRSVEDYLQYALIEYGYNDPNAWIVTEFKDFDPIKEKAKPYPFLVLASEAIDYSIINGTVEYLIVKQVIDGLDRYTMYLENDTLVYQEVTQVSNIFKKQAGEAIGDKNYTYSEFEPKGGKVPAIRVGYIEDIETRGRTFVSIFDKIVPFLKKIIKIDYEGDMSLGDLAFPKRYEYVEYCKECYLGKTPEGTTCKVCNGTGRIGVHRTTKDVREFTLPRDTTEMIDLSRVSYTAFPPVEGLKFQQDVKNSLKAQVMSLMFNADIFDKTQVTSTATEFNLYRDNLNDAVYPLSQCYERVWEFIVEMVAIFTDNSEGLIVSLEMPKDFKFKTLSERLADLQAARNAKASMTTISAIEDDLNEMEYADRPEELKKIRIKNSLNPFFGYSEEMVRVIVASKETTQYNSVLYSNLESIMSELEMEHQKPYLYDMTIEKINEYVKVKVAEYIAQMESKKPQINYSDFKDTEKDEAED